MDSSSETHARPISSHPVDPGGFAPGTILASRYHIVSLAGRGGMGEVYRADDLKLGQPVALKFLPAALERDPVARDRLLAEVRSARTVSHPNVCRVYDVGEVDGRAFLTMEYIDGEDLASLLRRIGKLPAAKALEVARQLCAGLAAAHEKGVLHRDLKPANVMIDGRGQARITDFGLALRLADELEPSRSG
jgi:serine/threonine protein kinase